MYSFYGGKQGRTYHIVERYDSIYLSQEQQIKKGNQFVSRYPDLKASESYAINDCFYFDGKFYKVIVDKQNGLTISNIDQSIANYQIVELKGMVNYFSLGGSYTDVNYGQYVIIDTFLNQRHRNDDVNGLLYRRGLEYTEPAVGSRPIRESYDTEQEYNAAWYNYILHPGGGAVYVGQILGPQGLSPQLQIEKWSDFEGQFGEQVNQIELDRHLGYQSSTGKFYDKTKVGWVNIKDADGDTIQCYLSFDIPTTLFRFRGIDISPYGQQNIPHEITDPNFGDDAVDYFNVTINNYSGAQYPYKGYTNSLVHLHKMTGPKANHPYFYDYAIAIPKGIHGQDITNVSIAELEEGQHLKFDLKNYNRAQQGDITSKYIPYRVINEITPTYLTEGINWTSSPTEQVRYNIGTVLKSEDDASKVFICVKAGYLKMAKPEQGSEVFSALSKNGDTRVNLTIGTIFRGYLPDDNYPQSYNISNPISEWLYTDLPGTSVVNTLNIDYTYGEDDSFNLRQVEFLFLGTDDNLYVKYTDKNQLVSAGHIDTVKDIHLQDGLLTATGGDGIPYTIGKINYIEQLALHGDCVIALHSDLDYDNEIAAKGVLNQDYFIIDGRVWENLGSIVAGNHILGDFTLDQLLNSQASGNIVDGLPANKAGWIITVTLGQDQVYQYAYDYNKTHTWVRPDNQTSVTSHWYPIAAFDMAQIQPRKTMIIDSASNEDKPATQHLKLNTNGFWFVVSN